MKGKRRKSSQLCKFPCKLLQQNNNNQHLEWPTILSPLPSNKNRSKASYRSYSRLEVQRRPPRRSKRCLKWIETRVVRRWTLMISEAIWTWVTVKMEEKCEASGRVTKSKREPRQTRRQTSTDRSSTQMSSKSHLIASQIRASLRPVMLRFAHAARLYLTNPAC